MVHSSQGACKFGVIDKEIPKITGFTKFGFIIIATCTKKNLLWKTNILHISNFMFLATTIYTLNPEYPASVFRETN